MIILWNNDIYLFTVLPSVNFIYSGNVYGGEHKGAKMSWIEVIGEGEAEGELKDIYTALKEKRGKVANIMKIHSLNPASMRAHMDMYVTLMFGKSGLTREEREMIAVSVSSANGCDYCINHHAEALNHYWRDGKKIEEFIKNYDLPWLVERKRKMIEYAVKLTKSPGGINENDINELRQQGFSDRDILDINLIASYFNFVNRIALGLGVEFTPDEIKGYNVEEVSE